VITLSQLFYYPVKSCAGVAARVAEVGATGLEFDRRWMVVDGAGGFLSQRQHPELARVTVTIEGDHLSLRTAGLPALEVPLDGRSGPERTVTVWRDQCPAVDEGDSPARWFSSFLNCESRLVRLAGDDSRPMSSSFTRPGDSVSFADAFPFLLLSEGSLSDLNRRLETSVPIDRFRPNIVVDGCDPYAEDGWQQVRIGNVPFRVAKPCARCVITTTDQTSGERGPEPLRTLAQYRQKDGNILFGQNLVHEGRGTLRVGDTVEVEAVS
jgi:uncharacterized protein YcbX